MSDLQKIERPTAAELLEIRKQSALIQESVRSRYPRPLAGDDRDLDLLQRLLDDEVFLPTQTHELQSLGLAFGDAIRKRLGLEWIIADDEYGREPALLQSDSAIVIFPLTMVAKRVEAGERLRLRDLVAWLERELRELSRRGIR
jgi:uncharacterized protein DUF3806